MDENLYNRLVYLDHNILDPMTKGDPYGISKLFENNDFIATYSVENLNEIRRSKGYEDSFLELLRNINARYVVPNMDEKFRYTGTAQVHEGDPFEMYRSYIENTDEMPELGYGMTGMVRKMYGGMADSSFSEIFEKGAKEICELTQLPDEEIEAAGLGKEETEQMKELIKMLPDILDDSYSELGRMLDKDSVENATKDFEKITGVGPKVLKNISGPNSLAQVWGHIEKSFPGVNITLEKFFGLDRSEWGNEEDRELSVMEKVNAIYHQLNYVGYFRDTNMKKSHRFTASFSDMTHAGVATFCKVFICRDEDLVMKAAAAYEYLGLHTKIVHIKANKSN